MESHTAVTTTGTARDTFSKGPSRKSHQANHVEGASFLTAIGSLIAPEDRGTPPEGKETTPSGNTDPTHGRKRDAMASHTDDEVVRGTAAGDCSAPRTDPLLRGHRRPGTGDPAAGSRSPQGSMDVGRMTDASQTTPLTMDESGTDGRVSMAKQSELARRPLETTSEITRPRQGVVHGEAAANLEDTDASTGNIHGKKGPLSPSTRAHAGSTPVASLTHLNHGNLERQGSNTSPATMPGRLSRHAMMDPTPETQEPDRVHVPWNRGLREHAVTPSKDPTLLEPPEPTESRNIRQISKALASAEADVDPQHSDTELSNEPIVDRKRPGGLLAERRLFSTSIIDRIAERMTLLQRGGRVEMRIDLKPEFLGRIRLHLASEEHQMAIRIVTELPNVKGLIEDQLHQLRADLQERGVDVGSLDVRTQQEAGQSDSDRDSELFAKKRNDGGEGDEPDPTGTPDRMRRSRTGGATIIDYFV